MRALGLGSMSVVVLVLCGSAWLAVACSSGEVPSGTGGADTLLLEGNSCESDAACESGLCAGYFDINGGGQKECFRPCETANDCDPGDVCATLSGGRRGCEWDGFCADYFGPLAHCVDNVPSSCDVAIGNSCETCGCLGDLVCFETGCEPPRGLGEACRRDEQCVSANCSEAYGTCMVPLGSPCTVDDCEKCFTRDDGWSACTRDCSRNSDCSGGTVCASTDDGDERNCWSSCEVTVDVSCPVTCRPGDEGLACACGLEEGCTLGLTLAAQGEACAPADECEGGACWGGKPEICTRDCSDGAPCDAGFTCVEACASGGSGCAKCLPDCTLDGNECDERFTCRALHTLSGSFATVCDPLGADGDECGLEYQCRSGDCDAYDRCVGE